MLEPGVKGDRRGGQRTDRRLMLKEKKSSCSDSGWEDVGKKVIFLILWVVVSKTCKA